ESRVPLRETLAPLITEGLVDVERVSGRDKQREVYCRCTEECAGECRWMAMIDVDEFLVPHRHDSLPDLLGHYEEYGGLAGNWQIFGPSGHQVRPPGLQIANFRKKIPETSWPNESVKTIVRPETARRWNHCHIPTYKAGFWSVNEAGERVNGS